MSFVPMKLKTTGYALLLGTMILGSGLSACSPTNHVRGNILHDYQLAELRVGEDTQTDVLRKIGSPTTKAPFDENRWYYIGQETEKRGILDEDVIDEKIIVVSFDENGVMQDVMNEDNERIDLPYSRRKTPTSGNEMNVLQQFLGNLGRFNTPQQE